jgi:capsule polysaccharide export protein KpsE/RkpR
MPPDSQSGSASSMAMMAAMAARISGGPGSMGGGLGSVAGDLLGVKTSGALFIGVLRSETAQDRLVQQFDLRKVYGRRIVKDARAKLDENTSISEDRKSGIITISVTDHSPQRAAALANAYVDELNSLVSDLSTSSAHRERVFLEARLKVIKQGLDEASDQFAQFSSKNSTLDMQQEGKAMLDVAANLAAQMVAAQSQLEGLRQIYTDNNSRVRSLKARVEEIQKELGKLSGANNKPGESSVAPADSPEGMPSIRNLPLLGVKYSDYYRSVKIQETVYELLTQQCELAKVQEAKETPSVKILDPATVPEEKSFPPRLMIMFLGTSLVFVTCVVWVWGVERWKEVDAQDPRKVFLQEAAHTLKARMPWVSCEGGAQELRTPENELDSYRPPGRRPGDR